MAKFFKQVIYTFHKRPGEWRIDGAGYFEKLAELIQQYPNGELTGDVHSEKRDFIAKVRVEEPPLTRTQEIKAKFQQVLGFRDVPLSKITPSFVKRALVNRTSMTFMQAVALECKGKQFWEAVDVQLDRVKLSRK